MRNKLVREADLFWASLVGYRDRGRFAVEDVESLLPAEALPAGQTASPCDIAKTSETLDRFALDSAALKAAHRTAVDKLADCLLALRGGSRPIRTVDIAGFTCPTGTPAHNDALGQRRAESVRDALVAALNRRVPASAASFTFRLRSAGQREQIPGGLPVNRRVEVSVEIAVTDIVVHASDTDTHEIRSNLGAPGLEHFCCVKDTGDIVLEVQLSPDIPGDVSSRLTWTATATAITSPAVGADGRTAKLLSAASGKFPVELGWDGARVRQAIVWVIWSKITVTATRNPTTPPSGGSLAITAGIDHTFTIDPPTIITDADRPALNGPRTAAVPGAALTHVISGNTLANGATNKWDASRQIQMKILNPHLYSVAQLAPVAGHLWTGQPVATAIPENYPANGALGNDDTTTTDETNDPYANGGVCTATDDPQMVIAHGTGSNGDTFETRFQFHEFLRVNLDTQWYRASDFSLWRFHARFRRAAGAWTNNGSTFARDNNGF
ncbi:MAG TPA: OmpA family protein [Vicinamibacterales bacterium]|nr:OmpA family protein [Vicinamibacterales bacterium]